MTTKQETMRQRRESALKHCQERITWYEKNKLQHRLLYQSLQVTAIVLGALTPLLILLTDAKPAQAIVAVLAAIATGLNAAFQWKDSYIRFAYASEALKNEKIKFEIKAYDSDEEENKSIENFVNKIGEIVMMETSEWRVQKETSDKSNVPSIPTE